MTVPYGPGRRDHTGHITPTHPFCPHGETHPFDKTDFTMDPFDSSTLCVYDKEIEE